MFCLTFDDDGVNRFIDATADRADGEKKKMNGRGKEKWKMKKSGHFRRHVSPEHVWIVVYSAPLFLFRECGRWENALILS